ncbi:MAG: hypothetical protein LBF22_14590 [Deltaproteobacteria bacterium]|jgi:hypothetical protein|nr:hypothetical protein [Deltaproteobacteria bacterium]
MSGEVTFVSIIELLTRKNTWKENQKIAELLENKKIEDERKEREIQERIRQEKEKNRKIIAHINSLIDNSTQNERIYNANLLDDIEIKAKKIRNDVLSSLNNSKIGFETVDLSLETPIIENTAPEQADNSYSKDNIRNLYLRLNIVNPDEANKIKPLIQEMDSESSSRLEVIAIQLKLSLGRALGILAKDKFYRDELDSLKLKLLDKSEYNNLVQEITKILSSENTIDNTVYEQVLLKYNQIIDTQLITKTKVNIDQQKYARESTIAEEDTIVNSENFTSLITEILQQKGYRIFDENGIVVKNVTKTAFASLDLGTDYKAMIKVMPGGKVSLRLIRVVSDENDLSHTTEYQRQKDLEAAKKWCKFCEHINEDLKLKNILSDYQVKRGEDEELLVLVNKKLADDIATKSSTKAENSLLTQSITKDDQ